MWAGLGGECGQEGAVCHATWRIGSWVGLGGSGERRSVVEAVGYLTCAESDMKQPSDSLAGASRRPVTTDQWVMARSTMADGGLSVLVQAIVRVVMLCLHKSTLGKVQWTNAGGEGSCDQHKRGTSHPTNK